VGAAGFDASIFPFRVLNCASVMSLAQQRGPELAPDQGTLQLALSGVSTMLVVVCRSHSSWRQTSWPSFVNVTSHSTMPAPMRAPAS
jgi:hypothetical protein